MQRQSNNMIWAAVECKHCNNSVDWTNVNLNYGAVFSMSVNNPHDSYVITPSSSPGMKMTPWRVVRIVLIAFAHVVNYFPSSFAHEEEDVERLHSSRHMLAQRGDTSTHPQQQGAPGKKIHIFYNLYLKSGEDEERVRNIVQEQFQHINPLLHDASNITITSIGYPLSNIPLNQTVSVHHDEGSEMLTLHSLWEYCRKDSNNHASTKVIYLHSKGSFHPQKRNDLLRDFLTRSVLSNECANLPESCNVCSSRMSPLPHPHTSGNMWLARCDYVSQLFNPSSTFHQKENPCKGWGRYLAEHWVHSHPSVKPCDVYPGKEFTWDYVHIPSGTMKLEHLELALAPRFKFKDYIRSGNCHNESRIGNFVTERMKNYELLYNITEVDDDWWGWEFILNSFGEN